MDNVQICDSYINIPSSQTYITLNSLNGLSKIFDGHYASASFYSHYLSVPLNDTHANVSSPTSAEKKGTSKKKFRELECVSTINCSHLGPLRLVSFFSEPR
jgi:hypothetical protein